MSRVPARSQLRLDASTALAPSACLELIRESCRTVKPGANYAGQGLSLDIVAADASSMAVVMTDRSRELCRFTADVRTGDDATLIRIGGLDDCVIVRHSVMFVPVGKEIAGFGYYKRFLGAVDGSLRAKDPGARVTIAVPARVA